MVTVDGDWARRRRTRTAVLCPPTVGEWGRGLRRTGTLRRAGITVTEGRARAEQGQGLLIPDFYFGSQEGVCHGGGASESS